MHRFRLILLVAATLSGSTARAQSFQAAATLALPIGDLGNDAKAGFGVVIRTEGRLSTPGWSVRGEFSWDRFGGQGNLDNFQYMGFGTSLVHHSGGRLYQMAGAGFYTAKTVLKSGLAPSESDFGLHAGVGLNLSTGVKSFIELEVMDVFTTGRSSVWFPVRFGIRL